MASAVGALADTVLDVEAEEELAELMGLTSWATVFTRSRRTL